MLSGPAPGGVPWPRVTIVTPSYQQGDFLEETIRSVLLQGYPNLEYRVYDGGSTDQTRAILEKYSPWIDNWVSERDRGQSHAINKGFASAGGEWVGWQNSDDVYAPSVLHELAQAVQTPEPASVFYGAVKLIDAESRFTGEYATSAFDLARMFPWANMFNQSMFFHRRVFAEGHLIDESWRHYLDHEFFWRLILAGHRFQYHPAMVGHFRLHDAAKGFTQTTIAAREFHQLHKRLYLDSRLPVRIRHLALQSLRTNCINLFGQSQWDLFEPLAGDLKQSFGWRALGAPLSLRWLALGLGRGNVQRVKSLVRRVLGGAA